jgi:hypothetical protein
MWFFIPFVNVYYAMKLLFFPGQKAENMYGPSPYR